jgi:hypothetical protein
MVMSTWKSGGYVWPPSEDQKTVLAKYICSADTILWKWLTTFCYIIPNYYLNKNLLSYHCLLILSIIMYKRVINNVLVFNCIYCYYHSQ